jgi:putative oxidoreductase
MKFIMSRSSSVFPLWQTAGLTLLRVIVGIFMIYHGREIFIASKMDDYLQWDMFKNSSSGKLLVYIGKGAELAGGILLLIGLFTRIAALILIGTMSYISFFVGHGKIWDDDQHPFLFVLLAMVFLFIGGGRFSIDYLLFKKK